MNTIKKLFNGRVYPFEAMRDTKEMLRARNRLHHYLEKADETRENEDGKIFSDKVFEEIAVIETSAAEQGFELGFSLGLRFTAESYRNT